MLGKSLIQFYAGRWGCVPSLSSGLRPNYGKGDGSRLMTSFKMTYASFLRLSGLLYSVPLTPRQVTVFPRVQWDSQTFKGKSGSITRGIAAPFSWVLVYTRFCRALHEPVSPFQWKFCNQIPLAFKVKFLGYSQSQSVVGPGTFATVRELLWCSCLPVLGLLLRGCMVGLVATSSKKTYATRMPPRSVAARVLSPWQATADPCLLRGNSDTQRHVWSASVGSLLHSMGSGVHKVSFAPSECFWRV